jgi:hypothetical protein
MQSRRNLLLIITIIAIGAASRLIPHPPNFTAIAGITLFGVATLSRKWLALLITFAALFLSDLLLNNMVYAKMYPELYSGFTLLGPGWKTVYLGFGCIFLLGFFALKTVRVPKLILTTVSGSVIFFLITNFGAWMSSIHLYPRDLTGLMVAYIAGLPFFLNSVIGDLFYVSVFFGGYYLVSRRLSPARETSG